MVCSKRVTSVLLALCALAALCAVGAVSVSADTIELHNHSSRSDQYAVLGWSVDPDFFIYDANTLIATYSYGNRVKLYDGPAIAFCTAQNNNNPLSYPCPWLFTPTTDNAPNFVLYDPANLQNVFTQVVNGFSFTVCAGRGESGGTISSTDYPSVTYQWSSIASLLDSVLDSSGFSVIAPEPEPGPDPDPDPDSYNPIPDVYTSLTPSLYFTNYKSTGENSFAYLNRSFSEFPSPDYAWTTQFPDVILGAFYNDFSSNLEPLDSIAGQASVVFTDPLGVFTDFSLISSLSSYGVVPFSDVEIWLVNGSEPTLSGFQYFVCPSSWISTKLWRYPISQYSTEYVCNFQINLPEDYIQTVGFTPANFFVRIYRSTAGSQGVGRPYDVWYDVTNFVIGVYDRPSSDPDDIPPVPYNPSFSDPSNPGQEVTNALDEEERRISDSYNPDESMDSANSTFDLSALGSAFSRLADGIGYTGTSFSFKFPASGTVPFLNVSLWNETEIPFKQWIDALPVSLLYVVRFLAWLGLGFSFAHMIRKLISDLNGGDKD